MLARTRGRGPCRSGLPAVLSQNGNTPMGAGGDLNFSLFALRAGLQEAGLRLHGDRQGLQSKPPAADERRSGAWRASAAQRGQDPPSKAPGSARASAAQPGQEKRRRAGQDPLPEELVILDQHEADQEGLQQRQEAARQRVRGAGQDLHQFCRTRFQAHLFHISGMLAHPCRSTQDLLELARGWARIVADSSKKTTDQAMLREAARRARSRFAAAMHILHQLRQGRLRKEDLDAGQRELVEEEASGELRRRLDEPNDLYGFSGVEDRHARTSRLMMRDVFGDRCAPGGFCNFQRFTAWCRCSLMLFHLE